MNENSCNWINDHLIEFADGELPDADGAIVEKHLRDCASCRRELSLLEQSLGQARAIWEEAAAGPMPARVLTEMPAARRGNWSLIGAAAAILVLTLGAWAMWESRRSEQPTRPESVAVNLSPSPDEPPRLAMSDINSILASEARAARLAVSAELLSTDPSLEHYTNQAEEYLATNYANSNAGQRARRRFGHDTIPRMDPEP